MKVVFSHDTALEMLRAQRAAHQPAARPIRTRTLADCRAAWSEVAPVAPAHLVGAQHHLHVLVGAPADLRKSRRHTSHLSEPTPPAGSFVEWAPGVLSSSPELLFVQMACVLDPIALIVLGWELCGTYTLQPRPGTGFKNAEAATSKAKLAAFVDRARGRRGATSARRALKWVADFSNSPAETALALYLALPVRMGGYGLPMPDMNPVTALGKRAQTMLGQRVMRCDLHWVERRVVAEYDSDAEHTSSRALSRDAQRRNALGYENIQVVSIRRPMIAVPAQMDAAVTGLAKAIGKRLSPNALELTVQRAALRLQLFPWLVVR